jgi:predicted Kef-type K+ transport protein
MVRKLASDSFHKAMVALGIPALFFAVIGFGAVQLFEIRQFMGATTASLIAIEARMQEAADRQNIVNERLLRRIERSDQQLRDLEGRR